MGDGPAPDSRARLNAALDGRYRVERELGEGGMAVVYLAEDLRHRRPVALKVLKAEVAAAVGSERFLDEIETTANLRHPHILPLFDSGEADGFLFYVMPYVEGESLRDRLAREGRLPVAEAVEIAREVASALEQAHSRGVVHRDIKPANVLLGDGGALLADFGIATAVAEVDRTHLTATGVSLGTPSQMSPEQISGDLPVDGRSDIYSLGCVLYEMLTEEPPFSAPTLQAQLARTLTAPVPAVRKLRPEVPERVSEAISRALAKEPEDRFPTAEDFRAALAAPTVVREPRRGRFLVLATGAAVALGAAAVLAWRSVQTSNARSLIPEASRLADEGRFVEAFELAERAERWVPEDPVLADVLVRSSDLLTITTDPPGAEVFIEPYLADPGRRAGGRVLGVTPIEAHRLPRIDHRVVVTLEGYEPVERPVSSGLARDTILASLARNLTLSLELHAPGEVPEGMVPVGGGEYRMASPDAPPGLSATLQPFFIDRFEVTNEAFGEFVEAGGYATDEFWPDVPFDARSLLRDRTGLPGPRGWARQRFPEGQGRFPVASVTWYEADAYCRSLGRRLPTVFEWEKAARDGRRARRGVVMPWGYQGATGGGGLRANFSSEGPTEVDAFPFGISPYGAYAMAGNVREWTANPSEEGRVVTGGSWDGPSYLYTEYAGQPPAQWSPSLGFRCATSEGPGDQGAIAIDGDTRTPIYDPVDEETFETLLAYYRYDPIPANPRVTETVETAAWTRERIWIDGPAGDSILVYFYSPHSVEPPYQTILYAASSSAFFTESVPEQLEWVIGPVVQGGRAAVGVVLKGMVERGFGPDAEVPDPSSVAFRDLMVLHATELRLGLDYAEARGDVDSDRVAYLGVSFGAGSRLAFSAVDDRYRSVIYVGGGIDERVKPTLPEADNVNFAPYVRVPKLLLNGRSDEEHPWLSRALPLWNLLSEPKELVLIDGAGHLPPLEDRIPPIIDFLDRTLGPVGSR